MLRRADAVRLVQSVLRDRLGPGADPATLAADAWRDVLSDLDRRFGGTGAFDNADIPAALPDKDAPLDVLTGALADALLPALRSPATVLEFRTSGSTGQPKACPHTLADLLAEVEELAELLPGRRRVLSAVPPHHIYGFLFTVLLPALLDVPVLPLLPGAGAGGGRPPVPQPGDLIVSFPDHWRFLERNGTAWPADVHGTCSTAPADPRVLAALLSSGLARILEVYGASETAGIGWRLGPDDAYTLFRRWTALVIDDPTGPTGSPARLQRPDGRWVAGPDALVPVDARRFVVRGRLDGAVQVGG